MEVLFILPITFLCLFILYLLSRNDFVLLRQNISLGQVFDMGIMSLLFSFLISRVFYLINNIDFELLNILAFLHLLRYPGLSALGFMLGGVIAIYFFYRKKKGIRRIYDIYAISFLPLFAYYYLIKGFPGELFIIPLLTMIILTGLFFYFVKAHIKYLLRDGTISYIIVFLISLNTFLAQYFNSEKWKIILDFSPAQIISFVLMIVSIIFAVINQKRSKS